MLVKEKNRLNTLNSEPVLKISNISKTFSGTTVLKNVNLELYPGEVHALMGENGAGKSTLIKILAGIHIPDKDKGHIYLNGKKVCWMDPIDARENGISVVHQELTVSPNLTISENILMGTNYPKNRFGFVKWDKVHQHAQELLNKLGFNLHAKALVSSLSIAQQQMVEIARALAFKAKVLILDEPTASLTDKEIFSLFQIIHNLKKQGVAIVYISHRMEEIFEICDRFTVLRDGESIISDLIEKTTPHELVKNMVGREMKNLFNRIISSDSINCFSNETLPALELKNVSDNTIVKDVSFKIYPGEIVGLAGLVGSGRTELMKLIFGASKITNGEIYTNGQNVDIASPIDAIKNCIAHVPESRKDQALFLSMSVKENITITELSKHRRLSVLNWKQIDASAKRFIDEFNIKTSSPDQKVVNLSGGNQQKAIIARWLSLSPKVLLLDEPTRGVDIGAKTEIHKIISELAERGLAVLMISSELPEVIGMCDRVLVMSEGKLKGELLRKEMTQEQIMYLATGGETKL
ncbi:sugar ABC transporter ATP-binding protein [Bacillus sp. AFS055030]|uniref:sugar ABC transporter ATP-binding protein n=1 Tax=Bacillus sp. AFS055030 TaxID=2033507 RepID=UPI000BFBB631|nr:sugar ABC transporter ATP-binding protein [Bacillus sp. AFS055030]PGL71003.1 D-xylose ABC transporter ATP-binding protein [Bacillus sp. AFS055030]